MVEVDTPVCHECAFLEGGFPDLMVSGEPAIAVATGLSPTTDRDEQGRLRNPPGLATIGVRYPGFGYVSEPTVIISHPTAEGDCSCYPPTGEQWNGK